MRSFRQQRPIQYSELRSDTELKKKKNFDLWKKNFPKTLYNQVLPHRHAAAGCVASLVMSLPLSLAKVSGLRQDLQQLSSDVHCYSVDLSLQKTNVPSDARKGRLAGGYEHDFRMCAINNKHQPSLPTPHEKCINSAPAGWTASAGRLCGKSSDSEYIYIKKKKKKSGCDAELELRITWYQLWYTHYYVLHERAQKKKKRPAVINNPCNRPTSVHVWFFFSVSLKTCVPVCWTCMIVINRLHFREKGRNPPDVLQLGGSGSEDLDSICHGRTFLICPEH